MAPNSGKLIDLSVIGSSGFIGSAVVRAAFRRPELHVRGVARSASAGFDLRDATAVESAMAGTEMTVHAASYIGNDPDLCQAVNVRGTENVARAFTRLGGKRLVYVSTAAVYGRGPFRMASERATAVRPGSELSKSRARAEQVVLEVGGIVVRPHLVLGVGDRWVGPGVIRFARSLGGIPRIEDARHSVIEVSRLGGDIVDLLEPPDVPSCPVHLAQATLSLADLIHLFASFIDSVPTSTVESMSSGSRVHDDATLTHAASLLEVEHTFSVTRFRSLVNDRHLSGTFRLGRAEREWYRSHDEGSNRA